MRSKFTVSILASTLLLAVYDAFLHAEEWTDDQIRELSSMSLGELELPPDPTNKMSGDSAAAAFGQQLFFDERLSSNGRVSCASCHDPAQGFQDGQPLGTGVGQTARRTMPIAGAAYSPFLFWDGRKDSLWSQALGPLESPVEHGGTRAQYAQVVAQHYEAEYEQIFGALPDLTGVPRVAGPVDDPVARQAWNQLTENQRDSVTGVFVNIGKAIAAYERQILPGRSRFDDFVDTLVATGRAPIGVLSSDEIAGLKLFTGKANCTQCHNGPLFTNNDFHNTGVPPRLASSPDSGRLIGASDVLHDEFNCRSRWSDASPEQCVELEYLVADSPTLQGAFKVPSLRDVATRAPYMHAGQLATLPDVLVHYNQAPPAVIGNSELVPLGLTDTELRQVVAFLASLTDSSRHADATRPGRQAF
ncbi:MAG TPA: cytochrome c peroxidase [Woeseiaceae bacterium]|nr:cytochrome c peroxidase [Woeseiaceae bacterium]